MSALFTFIMGHKLYILNKFIRENKQIANDYAEDPQTTKKKYEELISKKN